MDRVRKFQSIITGVLADDMEGFKEALAENEITESEFNLLNKYIIKISNTLLRAEKLV